MVIDDSSPARGMLKEKLQSYPDIQMVGEASNGTDGIALVKENIPDLLFLDVEMPDVSGIDLLEKLEAVTNGNCYVVMFTAYSDYLLPSFRNHAFDFLLKPIDEKELDVVIQRFYKESEKLPKSSENSIVNRGDGKYLLYTNAVDFRLIDIKDIGIFQYNHDLRVWEVIVANRKDPIRLKRSITNEILLELNPDFVQVYQKYIINITYLMEVVDNLCHFYPPFDSVDYVKVGRFFRRRLIDKFNTLT